jgi:hypothetical protein
MSRWCIENPAGLPCGLFGFLLQDAELGATKSRRLALWFARFPATKSSQWTASGDSQLRLLRQPRSGLLLHWNETVKPNSTTPVHWRSQWHPPCTTTRAEVLRAVAEEERQQEPHHRHSTAIFNRTGQSKCSLVPPPTTNPNSDANYRVQFVVLTDVRNRPYSKSSSLSTLL